MTTSKPHLDPEQYNIMSRIANDWWGPTSHMYPLIAMNKVRVPFVCQQLAKLGKIKDANATNALEGIKILDVGCGGGILSEALAELNATVVGIEPVDKVCEAAKAHVRNQPKISKNITYLCETIEEHCKLYPRTYDAIIVSEVIEHVEDKDSLVKSCSVALKEDGNLFVTCPNKTITSLIFVHILFTLILNVIERHSHKFSWFIHHDTLAQMVAKYGMHMEYLRGLFYLPIFGEWFVIKYTALYYMAHFQMDKKKK